MDEDVKELTRLLANKIRPNDESSLTIKWAVIFGIIILIFGFLTAGYIANAVNIGGLQTEMRLQKEAICDFKSSQLRMENMVAEIRMEQAKRYGKGQ